MSGARADQRMQSLVMAEIIIAEHGCRNETIGAGLVELDEEPGARRPGNAAIESCADPIGEVGRDQALDCLAFSRHGAALGRRNPRRDFGQFFARAWAETIVAELQGDNQGAMDD